MKRIIGITILFVLALRCYGQEVSLPYLQNFDSATPGSPGTLPPNWVNFNEGSTDGCSHGNTFCRDWAVWTGATPSGNTGPTADHTSGSGNYVYMEASGNSNPAVLLTTPSFNLGGVSANLDFFIHNYNGNNENSHTLEIRVADEALTTYIGGVLASYTESEVDAWTPEQVDLSGYVNSGNIRIVFRWVYGGGGSNWWQHDIAIDDVSISSSSTTEICGNGFDDDADGLVDCLDADCDLEAVCDTDTDGLTNRLDYDDDNDGIPDALECYDQSNLITNAGFESGDTGFSSDLIAQTCTSDCGPSNDVNTGEYAVYTNACSCGGQSGGVQQWDGLPIEGANFMVIDFNNASFENVWQQVINVTPYREYSFNVWVKNINFSDENDPEIQLVYSGNGGATYSVIGTSGPITEASGWQLVGFNFVNNTSTSLIFAIQNITSGVNGNDIAIDGLSLLESNCDTDGDGVVNSLDLDSDNDGIYDVFESSSGQAQSGGVLTGGVDGFGIPSSVSLGSGRINYIPSDSDNDGILDEIELESDSDGCYDAFEENIDDPENNGIAGLGAITVDADGRVNEITYSTPTLNLWQNPGELNPGCDGDTDDDGVPDIVDLDDDNDGIPDAVENPANIDFNSTPTFLSGTGTLDDLDVGDKVVYSNAIRGCTNNFLDIVITMTAISANSVAQATASGINLSGSSRPLDDRHVVFRMDVVETGSATPSNPNGTPASVENFTLSQEDVDSNGGQDFTEIVGYGNSTPPDSVYLDPFTVLEQGGFVNGGGPGPGYTLYRMIPLSGPNDWTSNGGFTSTEENPEVAVFTFFENFSTIEIVFGQTGSSTNNGVRFTRFKAFGDCDRDMDGIPNRVDLDSDNDGIYDLYEAGHSQEFDTDDDGIIDGADVGSGANGLFDGVETSPESDVINYSLDDSDGDGLIFDFLESDSDGDLCFDTREADVADADTDGVAGTGPATADAFGRVTTIVYEPPPTNRWQDPTEGCLEICDNMIDDDGDGLVDEFDPDCANYYLEAECGFPGANWVRTFDLDASNNDYQTILAGLNSLDVPPTGADDILRFTVNITALGTYRILARVRSISGADDSFWFRVDEGTWYKWNDWDTQGIWRWVEFSDNDDGDNPVRYLLDIGVHTIDIAYREDGAGLDKLHLTINGSTPAGEGEDAINCQRYITTNQFIPYKLRNRD